ncbi:hypothetical protein AB0953_20485 [Streptomyces sp. NPDC046866]|uniref:hypothetical protein n=1 Tax=Streptomyces sp. NPDC046866 TaxID=3154921 RepID=UPI003455C157
MTRTRPRTPPRRLPPAARALALPAAALLLAAGCGIKPTGVVESGAPAKMPMAVPNDNALVYYLTPDDRLAPSTVPYAAPSPGGALARLLAGPTQQERSAGLRTAVPVVDTGAATEVRVLQSNSAIIEVVLPFAVAELPDLARRQLVCTALSSQPSHYEAALRGSDTLLEAAPCITSRP